MKGGVIADIQDRDEHYPAIQRRGNVTRGMDVIWSKTGTPPYNTTSAYLFSSGSPHDACDIRHHIVIVSNRLAKPLPEDNCVSEAALPAFPTCSADCYNYFYHKPLSPGELSLLNRFAFSVTSAQKTRVNAPHKKKKVLSGSSEVEHNLYAVISPQMANSEK